MGNIKLLDCTLRDGGYINDWRFGEEEIPEMIEKLEQTKVDILELGFLKNEPYQKDRTVFNSMEQVKALLPEKKPGIAYAVMCEVVNPLPLDMLAPADEDSADIIRVIVWKTKHNADGIEVDALQEGYEYCKGIVEKGYRLCVQPARVSQYSDEEFVSMVKQFSKLSPMAIYVVDSWGTENAEGLLHYMHLADENMPAEIALGYHGHNNMMQALGVSQAMLKENFSRDVIIDASVYGIGRGAGNLNLEIIAKYLNEQYGKTYDIAPMLEVYSENIVDIYRKEPWGFSIPYFLTAKFNCNPAYAKYYKDIPIDDISEILSSLSEEDRVIYREKTAKHFLKRNHLSKKKLAVIIPTADRHQTIDNWLFIAAQRLKKHNIDVIIFDSSKDSRTENVVKNYQIEGFYNIIYRKYEGIYDGFSLDHKVMEAFQIFSEQYEYLWACRDGLIVNGDVVAKEVFPDIQKQKDFIVVNALWRCEKKLGYREYTDAVELFRDQCMQMTVLGATIVKSNTIKRILNSVPLEQGRNYSLWQPIAYFEYIADHEFSASSVEANIWDYNTASVSKSHWKSQSMRQWCEEWYQVISNLPQCYDEDKPSVLKIHMSDFHPFYTRELLKVRLSGGLAVGTVSRDRHMLSAVCDTPIWVFYAVSILPKHFAKYLVEHAGGKIEKVVRAVYFIICGKVPGEEEFEE